MDEQLQAKIQEAKDAGYSDEEIQTYLATKNQPLPEEKPISRYDEQVGVMTSSIPDAAKLGLEAGAGYYAGKKILDAVRGPVQPQVPVQAATPANAGQQAFSQMGRQLTAPAEPVLNPTWDAALKQPVKQAPSVLERGSQYARQMQQIAAEKVMQAAGKIRPIAPAAIGAGAMLYSPGLNKGEEEELARRRKEGFNPNGALGATSGY